MSSMTILKVGFTLKGITPLLMHADDVLAADDLDVWRKDTKNKKISKPGDDRSPAWSWLTYLYSDGEHISIPAECLMACLRGAGAKVIMQRQTTFKESTQSGLFTEMEHFPLFVEGKQIETAKIWAVKDKPFTDHIAHAKKHGFSLYVKRARVGQKKHVRVRPRFEDWTVTGSLEVLDHAPELTFEVLANIFTLAGRVGLGDWRPGCKTPGRFGMFEAELKQE